MPVRYGGEPSVRPRALARGTQAGRASRGDAARDGGGDSSPSARSGRQPGCLRSDAVRRPARCQRRDRCRASPHRAGSGRAVPVLIEGESGSGKEAGRRSRCIDAAHVATAPFPPSTAPHCPTSSFEAELFGHARGAFTGAIADRTGVFEEAHGGTLFLDEVGELSPRAQAKLLRRFKKAKSGELARTSHAAWMSGVIAATNRDLRPRWPTVASDPDLLYRLDVVRIAVPALRDRPRRSAAARRAFLARGAEPRPEPRGPRWPTRRGAGAIYVAGQRPRAAERDGGAGRRAPRAWTRSPRRRCRHTITADRQQQYSARTAPHEPSKSEFVRAALCRARRSRGQAAGARHLSPGPHQAAGPARTSH